MELVNAAKVRSFLKTCFRHDREMHKGSEVMF